MQGQVKLGPENYESTPQITYIYEIKTSVQKKEQMCPGLSNSDNNSISSDSVEV